MPRAQLGASAAVRETLKLRDSDVWKNLAVMVGLPYIKRRLDEGYDIHAAPHAALAAAGGGAGGGPQYRPTDDLPHNPTVRQRLMYYYKWFLRNVYPSINAAYYFSILAFNLAYLFDNTKYSSPFLWLIGTRIRRLGAADHKAIAMATAPPGQSSTQRAGRSRPRSGVLSALSPQTVYPHLLGSLKLLLPASIFALKFLEWWHASDFSRQLARKATETLDLPAPVVSGMSKIGAGKEAPKPKQKTATTEDEKKPFKRSQPPISSTSYLPIFTVPIPRSEPDSHDGGSQGTCPICLNPLVNPTACQTGYVFCYTCVFRWLNGEHERQIDFMNGAGGGAEWEDTDSVAGDNHRDGVEGDPHAHGHVDADDGSGKANVQNEKVKSRDGNWESGRGRCPVTGRRVLGGTEGLRRVLV